MKRTDRLLACLGLVCGVGALVLALLSRASAPAVVAAQRPAPVVEAPLKSTTKVPVAWSMVAQRVRRDLRLNAEQAAELARILVVCEQSVQAAQQHPDALWRDRLAKRAHRDAYDLTIPLLTQEQREDFAVWLESPLNQEMACWFQRGAGCKGCGGGK